VVAVDMQARVEYLNPAAAALLGVPVESAAGLGLEELARHASEADRKLLAEPVHQALAAGTPLNLGRRPLVFGPESAERLVEVTAAPLRDEVGEQMGAVLLLHDATESRGLTRQISYQAAHDALTGLVNRREFERRLQEAVEGTRRGDGNHVLCYLDLDRFKAINDTSGHQAGDSLLRDIAKLVRSGVRDSDTVGRLGGDEFGLLLMGCPLDKARQIADDVCRKVGDHRFVWRDRIFNVGASIGLVEISKDAASIEEVLAAADSACYQAKRQGNHVTVYSARDELFARQSGEIHWLQLLQSALKEHRFELYCQPIVAAYGDGDAGPAMEVLVRLRNEAGEHVSPTDFLQAAERYRLMGLIDRQIVQTTFDALGRGAITLPASRSIGINISGQTLADAQFLEFVVECFDATGANPAQVCFEIAESAVIANMEHARRFIGVLHGMGCRFALDNFGSGLGSFSNLKFLAVDFLKIDGSFMRNLARDSVNQAMVTAMIKLARTLNFKVIAEQVEDAAAVDAARAIGVDFMQGYALGRPAPLPIAA
jgi:diguanylate cyclase (GGDEF)-like protein